MKIIPVARPLLPNTDSLIPYLRRIDASRIYTNFGPLVHELESNLAEHHGSSCGTVATVANATIGMVLALQARGRAEKPFCMVPAWTFAATAHAAVLAGQIPVFIDVDLDDWATTPAIAEKALAACSMPIGSLIVVMPFGKPIDLRAWENFEERTGVFVVIDAAAAFDSLRATSIPAVVSLHATKILGTGEGGYVVSADSELTSEIRRRSNFGFRGSRTAAVGATNAKLSEYAAAVGVASPDVV